MSDTQASPVPHPAAVPYWKCLIAGLPSLVLGTVFLMTALGAPVPLLSAQDLAPLLQVELIALNAAILLGGIGFVPAADAVERAGQRLILGLLGLFYLALALSLGVRVAIEFALLMLTTNLGLLLTRQSSTVVVQMVARWGIGFLLLMACSALFDLPRVVVEWVQAEQTLAAGAAYFLGMGLLDLTGFFLRSVPGWFLSLPRTDRSPDAYADDVRRLFAWVGGCLPARWR